MVGHSTHIPKVQGSNPVRRRESDNEEKSNLVNAGNTKGGSVTVPLTSCLTGLE